MGGGGKVGFEAAETKRGGGQHTSSESKSSSSSSLSAAAPSGILEVTPGASLWIRAKLRGFGLGLRVVTRHWIEREEGGEGPIGGGDVADLWWTLLSSIALVSLKYNQQVQVDKKNSLNFVGVESRCHLLQSTPVSVLKSCHPKPF